MAEIKNLNRLLSKLQAVSSEAKRNNVSVVVGYTAAYAVYVHENRQMKWRGFPRDRSIRLDGEGIARTGYTPQKRRGLFWGPNGRAGFLLDVMREMAPRLRAEIVNSMKAGVSLAKSLVRAGLLLQRESQKNVPVDTGNLRASAFTRLEEK